MSSKKVDKQTVRLNTILYPNKEDCDYFVKMANSSKKFGDTYVALDNVNFFPHITLYFPEYPIDVLDKVLEHVKKIANTTNAVTLTLESVTGDIDGGIFVNYKISKEALDLKKKVIKELNPLRDGIIRDKYKDSLDKDTQKYGYPINKYHFPHITLTVFVDKIAQDKFLKESMFDFQKEILIDKIAVCRMGEYGTCIEIVDSFELQKDNKNNHA